MTISFSQQSKGELTRDEHKGLQTDRVVLAPINGAADVVPAVLRYWLVQVPCIERNGLGAIKAVSAASLALRGDGAHFVPLDSCIETMRQAGVDMSERYKETSLGGLAVNIVNC